MTNHCLHSVSRPRCRIALADAREKYTQSNIDSQALQRFHMIRQLAQHNRSGTRSVMPVLQLR